MDFERLLVEYEAYVYPLTFLWTFLEGETFVIFAGYAAHLGHIDFLWLLLAAWFGSFSGDQFYFFLGRRYGQRVLRRLPRWQPRVDGALALLERYDTWFILSFRFIYGVRNVSSFAVGLSRVDWRRFMALNFLAAFIWALSFAGAGYVFGEAIRSFLPEYGHLIGIPALIVFAFVVWLLLRQSGRRVKAQQGAPGAE